MTKTRIKTVDPMDQSTAVIAVHDYLKKALDVPVELLNKPVETLLRKLQTISKKIDSPKTDVLEKLELIQLRIDINKRIDLESEENLKLQDDFCAAIETYSRIHGITAKAWTQLGIPRSVLQKAGILQTRAKKKI